MIGVIHLHYENKREFEEFVVTNPNFKEIIVKMNLIDETFYPEVEVKTDSVFYKITRYKGFVFTNLRTLYAIEKNKKFPLKFTYSQLLESITLLEEKGIDISRPSLSALSIVFYFNTAYSPKEVIKTNVLMHKLKEYSHNKERKTKKILKEFEYYNYTLGFYYIPKKGSNDNYNIKVELKLKNSVEFSKVGVIKLKDLKDKSNLENLFKEFLKKFDELTIIDTFESFDLISKSDKENLQLYINPVFWSQLTFNNQRQKKYTHKTNFERIQKKYKLNNLKKVIRESLVSDFNHFIQN